MSYFDTLSRNFRQLNVLYETPAKLHLFIRKGRDPLFGVNRLDLTRERVMEKRGTVTEAGTY